MGTAAVADEHASVAFEDVSAGTASGRRRNSTPVCPACPAVIERLMCDACELDEFVAFLDQEITNRHLQPGPDSEGQQALPHRRRHIVHGHAHARPNRDARVHVAILVVLHDGGSLALGLVLAEARHLPPGRRRAGDRHLKIHDYLDNLAVWGTGTSGITGEA